MNPILGPVPCLATDQGAVMKNAAPCPTSASEFLDSNMPVYSTLQVGDSVPATLNGREIGPSGWDLDAQVGRGTTYTARRMGDLGNAVSCTQVVNSFN
jgi:hypothetical protein